MTDDSGRPLRVVEAATSDPMTAPELQKHGNALLIEASWASRVALRASTELEILYATRRYGIRDIEKMQRQADDARVKWQTVSGILADLISEFHRSNTSSKRPGGAV
ncbi:hypothetical protein A5731_00505 [Mycolicibacterium conceptionense]|uniref:hypothetical protein n=1 Tax=Mycolicibacterium conceptionense TaxID=451644 RepID=UPI0005C28631|nr:hypothetical protein [Mycolicibacterium conceptionense]OBB15482.1 hypothetical protein A5718_29895 [Mycolicibacterium conceptionense]OBF09224.1 hypothetical protein A5731_00505 [Mycolicibacterium conceptionense]OBK09026.1 hypothetical protein A5639_11880 [Mycolicibacterium conceptionense]OMB98739.1 hypothetical protein A5746_00935 [Mycolicibacterium conceptionense]